LQNFRRSLSTTSTLHIRQTHSCHDADHHRQPSDLLSLVPTHSSFHPPIEPELHSQCLKDLLLWYPRRKVDVTASTAAIIDLYLYPDTNARDENTIISQEIMRILQGTNHYLEQTAETITSSCGRATQKMKLTISPRPFDARVESSSFAIKTQSTSKDKGNKVCSGVHKSPLPKADAGL
jgi:hypothetical protein